jgi:hypothetical protein
MTRDTQSYDCQYTSVPTVDFDDYEDFPIMIDEDDGQTNLGASFT